MARFIGMAYIEPMTQAEPKSIQIAMRADQIRSNLKEGLIWFVNYAALDPTAVKSTDLDLHNTGMLPQDVEMFAHRWLAFSRSIDIQHDGVGRPIDVLESFFNGPDIAAAAWPINSHAVRMNVSKCEEALTGLRDGTLNCVSLDAFTFDRVVKLPAAQTKSMGIGTANAPEFLERNLVAELAQSGFTGITSVRKMADGLYIAKRDKSLPIGIAVKDGMIETSAAGGAWEHIAASIFESGTLTEVTP